MGDTRTHFMNLAALAGIQAGNAFIPLLVFPYAYLVVGSAAYAQLAVAESVALIVLTVTLFSFEIDGVATVARLAPDGDRQKIADYVASVRLIQLLLFLAASCVALAGYSLWAGGEPLLLLLWLLFPLGYSLQTTWLYQGLQRNLAIAGIILVARAAAVGAVFWFVDGPADAWIVPLAIGGSFVAAGLGSIVYMRSVLGLRDGVTSLADAQRLAVRGADLFVSNASVLLYRGLNVLILQVGGAGAAAISLYSVAEKVARAMQAAVRPLTQFAFPRLVQRLSAGSRPNRASAASIARATWPQLAVLAAICLFGGAVLPLADAAGTDIGQSGLRAVGTPLLVMLPSLFFGVANFMFGMVGLSSLGARRYLLHAMLFTGALNIVTCFALARLLGPVAGAVAISLSEAVLLLLVLLRYWRGDDALVSPPLRSDPS